jgi:hypothetical protein
MLSVLCNVRCHILCVATYVGTSVATMSSQSRLRTRTAERFECRWASVEIRDSPAIMLQGMAGSVVGVWVAHGEGKCLFPNADVEQAVLEGNLAPIRYADALGCATEEYPANPNGSPHGIAALCSANGRHLAMMPHPERCVCTLYRAGLLLLLLAVAVGGAVVHSTKDAVSIVCLRKDPSGGKSRRSRRPSRSHTLTFLYLPDEPCMHAYSNSWQDVSRHVSFDSSLDEKRFCAFWHLK